MPVFKENFHTHTFRCKHAAGDANEYAIAAEKAGMEVLGISDHSPLPDGWTSEIRMGMQQLGGYFAAIEKAREESSISVIAGMECDIAERYFSFYRDELLASGRCRYLIGAIHYYTHKGEDYYAGYIPGSAYLATYTKTIIQGIQSGIFSFIAHPDHFAAGCCRWDDNTRACVRDIMRAAKAAGVPLEINGNGFRKPSVDCGGARRPPYPWRPFWEEAALCGVKVVLSSDAHRPLDVNASLDRCQALAEELGLVRAEMKFIPL